MSRTRFAGAWPVMAVLVIAGCGGCERVPSGARLNGGGSSFIYPLMSKWTSVYARESGVQVNYQSVGSGSGIQQMIVRCFDFGCTDTPLNNEQLRNARARAGHVVHIPLALGAVVPAYNLPSIQEPIRFTGPVLSDIFLGAITQWNDARLQELNPGIPLPVLSIDLVYRSDGSGTTYIWAEYLSKVSPEWQARVGVGTALRWPSGAGQKGNEGVAGQIARTPGALGYLELSYALQNKTQFGLVQNRAGAFVQASLPSITAAAAAMLADIPEDLRYSLTDAPGIDTYPISGTVWAVLYEHQLAGKGLTLIEFLRWATHEGQRYTQNLHYAALPTGLVVRVDQKLAQIQLGASLPATEGLTQ
jgi:phosphate transport system substrate-binding protein